MPVLRPRIRPHPRWFRTSPPTCAAKFEHGEVLCDNPEQQVLGLKLQREGGQNELVLRLRLCGKDVKIRYSEKHLLNFQQLLQAAAE
jgi:hypothetical protein